MGKEAKIRKIAELSMTLNPEKQDLLAEELKHLGADFQYAQALQSGFELCYLTVFLYLG